MTQVSAPPRVEAEQVLYHHERIGFWGTLAQMAATRGLYKSGLEFTKHCPRCRTPDIILDGKGWGECSKCELTLIDV